jgi:hypothetical protein
MLFLGERGNRIYELAQLIGDDQIIGAWTQQHLRVAAAVLDGLIEQLEKAPTLCAQW